MTSMAHWECNACVRCRINMQHRNFGLLDFLTCALHNKLRSRAETLSWWAFDVTFPGSNPLGSNRSVLNVSDGGSWKPKLTLKTLKRPLGKNQRSKFFPVSNLRAGEERRDPAGRNLARRCQESESRFAASPLDFALALRRARLCSNVS